MTFEEAIKEMLKASEAFKQAFDAVNVAVGEAITEKQPPPERKIDHLNPAYICELNAVAPDLMRDVIDFINEFESYEEGHTVGYLPQWLHAAIGRLGERVIASGFGCDLEQ